MLYNLLSGFESVNDVISSGTSNFASVCMVTVWKDLEQQVTGTAIDQWVYMSVQKADI